MGDRNSVIYVTNTNPAEWLRIDVPDGMITPPTITLHRPLVGPAEFYFADCYRLPIPAEARESQAD
jgi:hypothetical protein